MNWGFEKYEEEKVKLKKANLDPKQYEIEILKILELLGI